MTFGGGAGGGKSWLSAEWLLTNCNNYPGSRGRKELKRLRQSWFVTWGKVCKHHGFTRGIYWKYNGQDHYIEFWNGSRIDLLDLAELPGDPLFERFGSLEYTGGVIEEGGEIPFLAFDVLKGRVGRHMNDVFGLLPKILITCNPNKGWLYRIVYRPWKKGELDSDYAFVQALYRDNAYAAKTYERSLSAMQDPLMKKRLKDGIWEYERDDNSLIEYEAILDLFTNQGERGEKFLSGDIARYGRDRTVIGVWDGLVLEEIEDPDKTGVDESVTLIKGKLEAHDIARSRAAIDEGGVGGGVVDYLKGAVGFNASAKPLPNPQTKMQENYKNLRAQCTYMLAKVINDRRMAITATLSERQKEAIIADLEQMKGKDVEKDAPLQVVPKEQMKDYLGRSPDYGDMLMIRMYFLVHRKPRPRFSVA